MRLQLSAFLFCVAAVAQEQTPPLTAPKQTVTVEAEAPKVETGATTSAAVTSDQAKNLPTRAANVRDALPLIPGVIRTPEGRLVISSGPEHRSALLVNSVDVTDAATGRFGATVPIDIVERLDVYKTPFLPEYGRFSAGVVAVETRRGGEKWRYELNDPTPEMRIRSRHIRGIRGFTPRFSGGGPVLRDSLWFTGAGEFALRKRPIFPLPFPRNEEKSQSVNAHTQLDWAASAKHLVSWTAHGVPQRANFVGLSFYTPQPASPDYRGHEYRTAISDRYAAPWGTLDTTIAAGQTAARIGPQGDLPLTLLPNTTLGNYYFRQGRIADRAQWIETLSADRDHHHLRFGTLVMQTRLKGWSRSSPMFILDERFDHPAREYYRLHDTETAAFAQDGWDMKPGLRVDYGLRFDHQRTTSRSRVSPRLSAAWSPWQETGPTFRAGYGWFYDRVPLNLFAAPYPVTTRSIAPVSTVANVQLDQRLPRNVLLRLNYIDNQSRGIPLFTGLAFTPSGRARSQQFEVIGRVSEWMISYVYNRTHANLNEWTQYAGDYPLPVIRPDAYATAASNIPHRFLTWGVFPLRYGLQFAPLLEWRSGFPYSTLDVRQQYAEEPNARRFPQFFSLDLRVAKDIPFRKHKARVSFSLFNSTNHRNYDAVRLNTADPQFGEFLGLRSRRFRLDFDWLF